MVEPKVNLAGYNIKEWALILLLFSLIAVFTLFAIAVAHAIISGNATITVSGDIDVGQYSAIIIAMAGIASVLIAQKLTSQSQAAAVAATDSVWMEDSKDKPTS
ncbi:MAG: hypothetical protein E4H14_19290 [Candidatus Thorarchaeota archaeon]|nr:MAG: hypothetical protein E4H14_19290 [Candidatus Thorarchaeota archaeon]